MSLPLALHDDFTGEGTRPLDGAVPDQGGGQWLSTFTSIAGHALSLINGRLTFAPTTHGAGYSQMQFRRKLRSMRARFVFDPPAGGPATPQGTIVLLNADRQLTDLANPPQVSVHFAIRPTAWILSLVVGGRTIDLETGGYSTPCLTDGATEYEAGWRIAGNQVHLDLPDGTAHAVRDDRIAKLAGTWGIYEVIVNNDNTDSKGAMLEVWAETVPHIRVREPSRPRFSHTFDIKGGGDIRASGDERDVLGVAKDFDFETDEHGFGPGTLILPRPSRWDPMDSAMLAAMTTRDQEGRKVYEARVSGRPHTGVNEIEVETVGWSKHGDDDESARMIGRDVDLNNWQAMAISLKGAYSDTFLNDVHDGEVNPDPSSGDPRIRTAFDGAWSRSQRSEMWYDGQGVPLGQIAGSWRRLAIVADTNTNWDWRARLSLNDLGPLGTGIDTGNLRAAGPGTFSLSADNAQKFFAALTLNYGPAGGATGVIYGIDWSAAIYGLHGLPRRGTEPFAGHYVSDLAPYMVGRWCPAWTTTPDSIEQTAFIVPQSRFLDPNTTVNKMLEQLVLYGGNSFLPLDWFVYDDRTFYLRSPGTYGRTWRLRTDDNADELDQGPDVERVVRGVQVYFNPGDGTTRTVGFPGSNSHTETDQLLITDPTNPAVAQDLPIYKSMDMGVTSLPGAKLLGQMFLFDRNRQEWRGSLTVKADARDSAQAPHPPYMIRALEQVVLENDPDHSSRRIVGTKYSAKDNKNEVSIGTRPDRLDTLLARAGVVLSDTGIS